MNDPQLAAVAGLVGVGLSGGVQVLLAVRADRRDRRGCARALEAELGELIAVIQLVGRTKQWKLLEEHYAETPAWESNREQLARHLHRTGWTAVRVAYARFSGLRATARGFTIIGGTADAQVEGILQNLADEAVEALQEAVASLWPWWWRPVVRRFTSDAWKHSAPEPAERHDVR